MVKQFISLLRSVFLTAMPTMALCCISGGCISREQNTSGDITSARWHAKCLINKEYDMRTDGPVYAGEPEHLAKLVAMGEEAAAVLVELLNSDVDTPYFYDDKLGFAISVLLDGSNIHNATVADMADWGLRRIYGVDMGFRSYLPLESRRDCIKKWQDYIAAEVNAEEYKKPAPKLN